MKASKRTKALGLFAATLLGAQASFAADIYVRNAKGSDLSQQQTTEVTGLVKKAVGNIPEHKLVQSEDQADFVLQPSILQRGDEMVLRIEKEADGQIMAMAEEPINSVSASSDRAVAVTETAVNDDLFVQGSGDEQAADRSIASAEEPKAKQSKSKDTTSGTTSAATEDSSMAGGDVRAPSPRFANPNRLGYFQLGVGPSFAVNLESDTVMYDILASYNVDINENLTGKVFGDFNLATGAEDSRFINLGIGAEYYPAIGEIAGARPYVMGDVGYAFTRTDDDFPRGQQTKDAPAIGAGAGFKFMAAQLNLDVNLHYTILTQQIDEDNPQILGVRLAVNF